MNNFVLITDETDECFYFVDGTDTRISPKFMSNDDALTWLFSNYDESSYSIDYFRF